MSTGTQLNRIIDELTKIRTAQHTTNTLLGALQLAGISDQLAELIGISEAILGVLSPPVMVGGSLTFPGLPEPGVDHMRVVKDTQAESPYVLTPPDRVLDARGRPITPMPELKYEVTATAQEGSSGGITVTPDPANPLAGTVSQFNDNEDGSPAVVTVAAAVRLADGTLVGSLAEVFTITAGDPASIQGGGIDFPTIPVSESARRR